MDLPTDTKQKQDEQINRQIDSHIKRQIDRQTLVTIQLGKFAPKKTT